MTELKTELSYNFIMKNNKNNKNRPPPYLIK